ncbi:DUF4279 domain-containing protein [Streptomyces sp. NPDC048269]|uniref:DUF4279 domain-containing protein n=1 Tax=Streptomyces sp. NPDC048269 TaxID=3155753 RepID=UPI0034338AD9
MNEWVLTDVSLVVRKADLDPGEVTERLGLQPTAVRAPGADRWGPPGETDGQWRLTSDERTARILPDQLREILSAAEGCEQELHALQREGCTVSLAVYGFAGHGARIFLPADTVSRLARLGFPLTVTPNLNDR